MDRPIELGDFSAHVSIRDGVTITKDGAALSFSAPESETILQLLLSVMGVESFHMLPAKLQNTPFEVRFRSNRTMELRRIEEDPDSPGIDFSFTEGDQVIALVKQATAKLVSRTTIRRPTKYKPPFSTPDVPVEGH